MAYATVEKWVDNCQARGRYTFLRQEVLTGSGLSAESVKKALQRLVARGRVLKAKVVQSFASLPADLPRRLL